MLKAPSNGHESLTVFKFGPITLFGEYYIATNTLWKTSWYQDNLYLYVLSISGECLLLGYKMYLVEADLQRRTIIKAVDTKAWPVFDFSSTSINWEPFPYR